MPYDACRSNSQCHRRSPCNWGDARGSQASVNTILTIRLGYVETHQRGAATKVRALLAFSVAAEDPRAAAATFPGASAAAVPVPFPARRPKIANNATRQTTAVLVAQLKETIVCLINIVVFVCPRDTRRPRGGTWICTSPGEAAGAAGAAEANKRSGHLPRNTFPQKPHYAVLKTEKKT